MVYAHDGLQPLSLQLSGHSFSEGVHSLPVSSSSMVPPSKRNASVLLSSRREKAPVKNILTSRLYPCGA